MCSYSQHVLLLQITKINNLHVSETLFSVHLSRTAENGSDLVRIDREHSFRIHESLRGVDEVEIINERVHVHIEVQSNDDTRCLNLRLLVQLDLHCLDLALHDQLRLPLALIIIPYDQLLERVQWISATSRHGNDIAGVQYFNYSNTSSHFFL